MDEVDGMSGGDRGGVGELIGIIKTSKVPIICICNDKYNQKLKSLRNSTLELDFRSGAPSTCFFQWEAYLALLKSAKQLTCQGGHWCGCRPVLFTLPDLTFETNV